MLFPTRSIYMISRKMKQFRCPSAQGIQFALEFIIFAKVKRRGPGIMLFLEYIKNKKQVSFVKKDVMISSVVCIKQLTFRGSYENGGCYFFICFITFFSLLDQSR